MRIAIASGKGGTGKTLVAVNVARCAGEHVMLLDCDVEEPNDALFFQSLPIEETQNVNVAVPVVNESVCNGCAACVKACRCNALAVIAKKVLVFEELCHSCTACEYACPVQAISWKDRKIGTITKRKGHQLTLCEGALDVGIAMPVPLIRALKRHIPHEHTVLLDSPPGTSCPMIWTVLNCDAVVLVTEPTPFGLHDLQLAVETVRELHIPFAVVINKEGIGDDRVVQYCEEQSIQILAKIPHDLEIARAYAKGRFVIEELPHYQALFSQLWQNMNKLARKEA